MESLASQVRVLQSAIVHLKGEIAALTNFFTLKIDLLTAENSSLKETVTSLNSSNKSLLATNKSLSEENCKLKDKLGLTSKNSSIPSSKELYKSKRNKSKSIRSRGGQPGHAGTTRSKLAADEVIELPISDACSCGGHVAIAPQPYVHQKF